MVYCYFHASDALLIGDDRVAEFMLSFLLQTSGKMEEETLCKIDDYGDPGIQINFADATSTDNCLVLASLATVGPASGVPVLTRGKNSPKMNENSPKKNENSPKQNSSLDTDPGIIFIF